MHINITRRSECSKYGNGRMARKAHDAKKKTRKMQLNNHNSLPTLAFLL